MELNGLTEGSAGHRVKHHMVRRGGGGGRLKGEKEEPFPSVILFGY